MKVRVREVDHFVTDCRTRLPFRFGMTTMTWAPLCLTRVRIKHDDTGEETVGYSSDLLVPKWFEKKPEQTLQQDFERLWESVRLASEVAVDGPSSTVFDWWRATHDARLDDAPAEEGLIRGFGVALVERAVMDATCRAAGVSFFRALQEDLFGFRPGVVHPELEGWRLADSLARQPKESIEVRHTVGLADALRPEEIPVGERIDDGYPESLEEDIRFYDLRCFKVKIGGQRDEDLDRLQRVAEILADTVKREYRLTLDGNEQYEDLDELVALIEEVGKTPAGARFRENLLYIEQPLPRARSFEPDQKEALGRLSAIAPVIMDEADYGVDAFRRGVDLGYRGISVKNCKGVFQTLLNRGLCEKLDSGFLFQSAEDLTNLPVVALQQDLTTVAALGLPHVERNGHHYFRGLDHLPRAEARSALAEHSDLYQRGEHGVTLRIENGQLSLRSLQDTGYGYSSIIDPDERTPLDQWVFWDV